MARKTPNKQKIVKQPKEQRVNARLRKKPVYKSFRLHRSIKHHEPPLPNWYQLIKRSFRLLSANKKAIFVFFLVYGFLNLLLVRGFSASIDIEGIKDSFSELGDSQTSSLVAGFTAFGLLVEASTKGSGEVAQVYQSVLLVISSLAIIWLYRQQQAGSAVTMKMAFYRGMYPLVPFLLVLLVLVLQLLPAVFGNFLFSTVVNGGLIVGAMEQIVWVLFFLSMLLLSLYLISSTAIALYVVTLPDMTPLRALRQAKELVQHRRLAILARTIAATIVVFVILTAIVLPIVFLAPALAEWMFFSITVLAIPLLHGYMFTLYRELL